MGVAKRREVAPPYQPAMAAAVDSSFLYSPCGCFVSPPSLFLSALPSPFWLFVSRKSLKLILIFDLCQTNLGARHQTAPNRANYINFHIVSCFDTHSKKKEKPKKETKKRKPNRKEIFLPDERNQKIDYFKAPPKKLRAPFLLPQVGHISQAQMTQTTGRTKITKNFFKMDQNGSKQMK